MTPRTKRRASPKIRPLIDRFLRLSRQEEEVVDLISDRYPQNRDASDNLLSRPAVTYSDITFSDGTVLSLKPTDIVVLVGPNNAGKSAALREISAPFLGTTFSRTVTKSARVNKHDTADDFKRRLEAVSRVQRNAKGGKSYIGAGYKVEDDQIGTIWDQDLFQHANIFCNYIDTENRLTASNSARSFDVARRFAENPIQSLYIDDEAEKRISAYFFSSFRKELIVDRLAGEKITLLVGERPEFLPGEDRVSATYNRRLRYQAFPIETQGDGMRGFAGVMLSIMVEKAPRIIVLDEPEAFLHPPQARLLGNFIAKESPESCQIFLATHSADVLQGLLSIAPERLRIVRIQRTENSNRVTELPPEKLREIFSDPLTRFSSILQGLFYERVVICESDSDCSFYQSLLNSLPGSGNLQDVLFLHANGKHRISFLAESLGSLGVPFDVIVDLDVLNEVGPFERLVRAMGGDWPALKKHWQVVKRAVDQRRSLFNAQSIRQQITSVLDEVGSADDFPRNAKNKIENILRQTSPWDAIKLAGESAIPPGDAAAQMREIHELCDQIGLWLVPVGELEGFCRSIGGHGPRWVQQVLQQRDLTNDPELGTARTFLLRIKKRWDPPAAD